MAEFLGTQVYGVSIQSLYRLSQPLQDIGPSNRNIVVIFDPYAGRRYVTRGWAYERADGTWSTVPRRESWIMCFAGLSARDLAMAEAEIAACHGNWSA